MDANLMTGFIQNSKVTLYVARDVARAECASRYLSSLSQEEVLYAEKFRTREDRYRFISCRGIIKKIIALQLGKSPNELKLSRDIFGKPFVNNDHRQINFSISHSEDLAIFAVSENLKVGVDIEYFDRNLEEIATIFLTPGESSAFQMVDREKKAETLLELWTLKEAVLKADGHGLSISLKELDFNSYITERDKYHRIFKSILNRINYSVMQVKLDRNYASALAIEGDHFEVAYFDWNHMT